MHEIKEPMQIDKNDCQSFKLEKPAIKLPVHTPVKGRGIATKPPNKNIFLIEVFFLFIFSISLLLNFNLLIILSYKKPLDRFFTALHKTITGKQGIIEPTNVHRKATITGISSIPKFERLRANGKAILPSKEGIIAIRIIAIHI